ncbi:MAG: hypothetical protein AUG89_00740 [Acidobacteria bacterium 13_1_20CM_4_56_7]|nr:MAG: hypothetical protein AUG89_00740 [Acidobacteria bacterium 13_1_20CM_4_56_7]
MGNVIRHLLFFVFVINAAFAVRPGDFTVVGPGGGGAMFNPTVSPHDPNTVLISCDMTGSYITHDGGQSWRMFNLRGVVRFFVFDPLDPKVMYAQATGLWRSTDAGENWNLVYPKPASINTIVMRSDHSDEILVADPDPLGTIAALAIDPGNSKILFAAGGDKSHASLFVSHDWGENWTKQEDLPETPRRIWIDPNSPADSRTLYISGPKFLVMKDSGSVHKFSAPESVTFTDVSLGFTPAPVAYATSEKGVFASKDGGQTWRQSSLPGSGGKVRAVATSFKHGNIAYVSYSDLSLNGKKWMGVAKTEDAGESWQLVWKESSSAAPNVHDAWITARFGVVWGENPLELAVADQDPNLAYGTDLGRTMKTSDGGASWWAMYSRKASDGEWTSTGLDVTNIYGIHFDPFDSNRQFLTYTDIGLFRSEDGGAGYTHDLPRPKMWRHTDPAKFKGGVCVSDDGGKTWRKSNAGMEETAATHILLDPNSPTDARVLYVAGFGRGVYKSSDGGKSWKLKNQGITQKQPFAWRLSQASDGTLYVVIARRSEDGSIGTPYDGALYRSKDAAEHWELVSLPSGVNGPNALSPDPKSPERLYLAAWARASGTHGDGGGIFLSENGGQSWRQIFDGDRHVYDVTFDPHDANVVYASGFESSAWRSSDRGEHWSRIPGFNFKWGYRVIPDPADRNKIYISTFGGSLWHGSLLGHDEPEDIATPRLRPGTAEP